MGKGLGVIAGGLVIAGVGAGWLLTAPASESVSVLTAAPVADDSARVSRVVQGMADSLAELDRQGKLAQIKGGAPAPTPAPAMDWATYVQQKGMGELDRELETFLGDTPVQKAARRLIILGKVGGKAEAQASGDDWGLAAQAFEEIDAQPVQTLADIQRSLERMPDARPTAERNYLIQLVARVAEREEARVAAIELLQRETLRRGVGATGSATQTEVSSASFAFLQLRGLGVTEGAHPPTVQEDPWVNEIPELKEDGGRVPAATSDGVVPAPAASPVSEGAPEEGAL